jgi:hypothetical protein
MLKVLTREEKEEMVYNEWIQALRSGKYRQIKDRLANSEGFCAMGLLFHIAVRNNISAGRLVDRFLPEGKHRDVMYFNDHGNTFEEIAYMYDIVPKR